MVKVDIVNTTRSADSQLVFPSRLHQQHAEDDGDEAWKQSLGFIRLSTSNLVNPSAPPGNVYTVSPRKRKQLRLIVKNPRLNLICTVCDTVLK